MDETPSIAREISLGGWLAFCGRDDSKILMNNRLNLRTYQYCMSLRYVCTIKACGVEGLSSGMLMTLPTEEGGGDDDKEAPTVP